MKDLRPLYYILGMEVRRTNFGLHLTQMQMNYIIDLLKHTMMLECKPISTPAISGRFLSLHDSKPLANITEFCSVVGALQYFLFNCPDIAFAVN